MSGHHKWCSEHLGSVTRCEDKPHIFRLHQGVWDSPKRDSKGVLLEQLEFGGRILTTPGDK